MKLIIKPLTPEQVRAFIKWEYAGAYAIYNISPENEAAEVAFFLDPENGYFAITDEVGGFLGFCNFGADARVPGGDYRAAAIDIGMGLRPDLTGQGKGALYAAAVFDFAAIQYPGQQRVTIAEFNQRAQQLCRKFGFVQEARFLRETDGRPFVVLTRNIDL
jgi:ribosomal-protein-alanine N-acetyltransferase